MAISLVGTGSFNNASTGTATITFPGGVAQNDVAYASGSMSATSDQNITEASGTYTELTDLYAADNNDVNFGVYRKVQGATPDSSVDITTAPTAGAWGAVLIVLRGVNTATPEDATTTTATGTNGGTPDPPAIVTATANAWVLPFAGSSEADAVTNPPTNYSNLIAAQDVNINAMGSTRAIAAAGTENPATYADIVGAATDSWCAATVAVRPAAEIPLPPAPTIKLQAVQRAANW